MTERPNKRNYQTLLVRQDEHALWVTLNVPKKKNVIGPDMANELLYVLDDAKDDASVRVIVLNGAGNNFCAGGDLKRMSGASDLPTKGDYADLLFRFTQLGKPVVASVEGYAMGGGLGLMASSDFVVASNDAVLATPEVKVGLFPMMIMSVLARQVPRRALLEMMTLGKRMSGADGVALGLVNRAVPPEEVEATTKAVAEELSQQSPTALRHGLLAFHKQAELDLEAALPFLRDQLIQLLGTADAQEGLRAFVERRPPVWGGPSQS